MSHVVLASDRSSLQVIRIIWVAHGGVYPPSLITTSKLTFICFYGDTIHACMVLYIFLHLRLDCQASLICVLCWKRTCMVVVRATFNFNTCVAPTLQLDHVLHARSNADFETRKFQNLKTYQLMKVKQSRSSWQPTLL